MRSLSRGLAALDALLVGERPLGTTELAARIGVDKSVASRILRSLADSGFAERGSDRRYAPGPKLAHTRGGTGGFPPDLRERCRPLLQRLVGDTGECAHLAVLVGGLAFYLDKAESPAPLRVDHPVGLLAPLHCTALGKVLLAFADAPAPRRLERHTATTITEDGALQAELARTAARGFAVDNEEFSAGIRCVAAPVRDEDGRAVAAVGVSGPTGRFGLDRVDAVGAGIVAAIAAWADAA
ncbi:MAG: IclR family transcriptional regulator [Alphaproteobacteria bacterium]